eukprot:1159553-Pelagomonas_calceolata.AAC.6
MHKVCKARQRSRGATAGRPGLCYVRVAGKPGMHKQMRKCGRECLASTNIGFILNTRSPGQRPPAIHMTSAVSHLGNNPLRPRSRLSRSLFRSSERRVPASMGA